MDANLSPGGKDGSPSLSEDASKAQQAWAVPEIISPGAAALSKSTCETPKSTIRYTPVLGALADWIERDEI